MSKAEIVQMLLRHNEEIANLKAQSQNTQSRALTQNRALEQKVSALEAQQRGLFDKLKNVMNKVKDFGGKVVNKVGNVASGIAETASALTSRDIDGYGYDDTPYQTSRAIDLDDLIAQTNKTMNDCIQLNQKMKNRALPAPTYGYSGNY